MTGDKALLFEPASGNTRKLLDTLVPRLQVGAAAGGDSDGSRFKSLC